jgi:hypothetical protein
MLSIAKTLLIVFAIGVLVYLKVLPVENEGNLNAMTNIFIGVCIIKGASEIAFALRKKE